MTSQIISQNLVKFFSALLECCCEMVIAPMCNDNISQLQDRVKTESILRSSDLSDREVFVWMKKLANLKKRSEALLRRNESRAGSCSFVFVAFDNFEAAKYLQLWDKLDEEEPVPAVPAMPDSTSTQLTHESTAPVGAMDAQLTVYQEMGNVIRGRNDGNYVDLANRKPWVLDSLGILEGHQIARDLVSTPRKAVGDDIDGAAVVQSMHGARLIRSKSFEIIHEERVLVFDKRVLVNYHEYY